MSDITLSVVVPVYNTEHFLPKCIQSILSQTFETFELILINDGSSDKSLDICRRYETRDSRVRVLNQDNQGIVATRKIGVAAAGGKYLAFVDSDDYLEGNCFSRLMEDIEEKDYDIVIGNMYRVIGSRLKYRKVRYHRYFTEDYDVEGDDIRTKIVISYFDALGFPAGMPGKVYKTALFRDTGTYQDGIVFMGEDMYLNIEIFLKARKIRIVRDCLYNYRYGGGTSKYMPRLFADAVAGYNNQKRAIKDYYQDSLAERRRGISIMVLQFLKTCLANCFLGKLDKKTIMAIIHDYVATPEIREAIQNEGARRFFTSDYLTAIQEKNVEWLYAFGAKTHRREWIMKKVKHIINTVI
ncbi:MAG: glycosyltransferase [Lentisphaeria bacterium]|nr:glycosyltransferase [Lentisphaeria bacterium]